MSTSTTGTRVAGVVLTPRDDVLAALTVHGRTLLQLARAAMADAGISGATGPDGGGLLVVHDALCPLTPSWFVRRLVEAAGDSGTVHVGFRPVTDTIKIVHDGRVGATVDRDSMVAITSPLVLPPEVLAELLGADGRPDVSRLADLPGAVARLRERHRVELVQAPPAGRRIDDESGLRLLAALG